MTSTGFLQVHAYVSNAQIPLEDVAIAVTAQDGTAIAMRLTDRSGMIHAIAVPVPDRADSQTPGAGEKPFTTVNLYARKNGYVQIENEDVQVFPGVVTNQNLEMVPLSEMPGKWDETSVFQTPPQNL